MWTHIQAQTLTAIQRDRKLDRLATVDIDIQTVRLTDIWKDGETDQVMEGQLNRESNIQIDRMDRNTD